MSPTQFGNLLYQLFRSNSTQTAALRTEMNSLAVKIATDPSYGTQITSSTVNGQSFSGTPTMTNVERLMALRIFDKAVTNSVPPTSRTYATF